MAKGFLYFVAVIDWHSRKALAHRLSNTMDAAFCVEAMEEAIVRYGAPEVFNTDQGAQFTSEAFTGCAQGAWRAHLYGRQGTLARQCVRGVPLA